MIDDLDDGPREAARAAPIPLARKKPIGPFGFGQLR
jgi:hypothetical protein